MLLKTCYLDLARTNRLIVKVRERIESQKAQISELQREQTIADSAIARLHRYEVTLQLLTDRRAAILEKTRGQPLPLYTARDALNGLTAPPHMGDRSGQ